MPETSVEEILNEYKEMPSDANQDEGVNLEKVGE